MVVLVKSGDAGRIAMASDTRERMIKAAVHALRRDGVEGMSFTEVLRESGAARGAIYHHFPGGKSQLVAEAATENGSEVRGFLALIRPVVQESAGGSGCAVAAAAMASSVHDQNRLHHAAAVAIGSWVSELTERFAA